MTAYDLIGLKMTTLPEFEGAFRVRALKIALASKDLNCVIPEDPSFGPIDVTEAWFSLPEPVTGDYFLLFDDGRIGWMASADFEREFRPVYD